MIAGKVYKLRHPAGFYVDFAGQPFQIDDHFILIEEEPENNLLNLKLKFLSSMGLCALMLNNRSTALNDFPYIFEELCT